MFKSAAASMYLVELEQTFRIPSPIVGCVFPAEIRKRGIFEPKFHFRFPVGKSAPNSSYRVRRLNSSAKCIFQNSGKTDNSHLKIRKRGYWFFIVLRRKPPFQIVSTWAWYRWWRHSEEYVSRYLWALGVWQQWMPNLIDLSSMVWESMVLSWAFRTTRQSKTLCYVYLDWFFWTTLWIEEFFPRHLVGEVWVLCQSKRSDSPPILKRIIRRKLRRDYAILNISVHKVKNNWVESISITLVHDKLIWNPTCPSVWHFLMRAVCKYLYFNSIWLWVSIN